MGKVKLVIEIDERIIEHIKDKDLPLGMVDDLCRAVENGTRLIDGDLISRSALRKEVNTFYDNHFIGLVPNELIKYAQAVDDFIDNAPAVEPERSQGDLISRSALYREIESLNVYCTIDNENDALLKGSEVFDLVDNAPTIEPERSQGEWITIADVMSAFDDFMRGDVDENDTETFLEMLKDRAER